jgi:hypothetical protein
MCKLANVEPERGTEWAVVALAEQRTWELLADSES